MLPAQGLSLIVTFNLHPISPSSPGQSETSEQPLLPELSAKSRELERGKDGFAGSIPTLREHAGSSLPPLLLPLWHRLSRSAAFCSRVQGRGTSPNKAGL